MDSNSIYEWLESIGVETGSTDIPEIGTSTRLPAIGKRHDNKSAVLTNYGDYLSYYDFVEGVARRINIDSDVSHVSMNSPPKLSEEELQRLLKRSLTGLRKGVGSLYTTRKKIEAPSLYDVYGDGASTLSIPMYSVHGELLNLQTISYDKTNGKFNKRFLKGAPTKGLCHFHSHSAEKTKFIVCEGWATGNALQEFCDRHLSRERICVVSAMSSSNMKTVAYDIEETFPNCLIIFGCDNDSASKDQFTSADYMFSPDGEVGTDWDDVRRLGGNEIRRQFTDQLGELLAGIPEAQTIYMAPQDPGSGKTYTFVDIIGKASESEPFIYVAPSKALVAQTVKDIRDRFPDVLIREIHGDTVEGRVKDHLMQELTFSDGEVQKKVVCCTHVSFLRVTAEMTQDAKSNYQVFIDETMKVIDIFDIHFGKTYEHIEASFKDFSNIMRIDRQGKVHNTTDGVFTDTRLHGTRVKKLPYQLREDLVTPGRKLYAMTTPRLQTYLDNNGRWPEISEPDLADSENGTMLTVSIGSFIDTDIFIGYKKVTTMCAEFHNSLLAELWRSQRVNLVESEDFSHLKSRRSEIGSRLTIWSCSRRASLGHLNVNTSRLVEDDTFDSLTSDSPQEDELVIETVVKAIDKHWQNQKWLLQLNNRFTDDGSETKIRVKHSGINIPMAAEGRNDWRDVSRVAALGIINPAPSTVRYLTWITGLSDKAVQEKSRRMSIYQAVFRGSARDHKSNAPLEYIVISEADAEWLHEMHPNSTYRGILPDLAEKNLGGRLTQVARDVHEIEKYLNNNRDPRTGELIDIHRCSDVIEALELTTSRWKEAKRKGITGWRIEGRNDQANIRKV